MSTPRRVLPRPSPTSVLGRERGACYSENIGKYKSRIGPSCGRAWGSPWPRHPSGCGRAISDHVPAVAGDHDL